MIMTVEMPESYGELVLPVMLMNAVERFLQSGREKILS